MKIELEYTDTDIECGWLVYVGETTTRLTNNKEYYIIKYLGNYYVSVKSGIQQTDISKFKSRSEIRQEKLNILQ